VAAAEQAREPAQEAAARGGRALRRGRGTAPALALALEICGLLLGGRVVAGAGLLGPGVLVVRLLLGVRGLLVVAVVVVAFLVVGLLAVPVVVALLVVPAGLAAAVEHLVQQVLAVEHDRLSPPSRAAKRAWLAAGLPTGASPNQLASLKFASAFAISNT